MELFTLLPLWYQDLIVFTLGLIVGSFLNVVLYRFHTGKSLNGHSHCLSCGHRLKWYELIPLVSYFFLRGHCHNCGCHISIRYVLVEFSTAVLFLLAFLQFHLSISFFFSLLLFSVLILIVVYDIYHMVIPNKLVVYVSVLALIYYVVSNGIDWNPVWLYEHAVSALAAFGFYGSLWLVSKGKWIGLGDAKLALPLGFILGPLGTFSSIVFSFWIGAVISLLILWVPKVYRLFLYCCATTQVTKYTKSLTMKSEVPFAPFMIVAFLLVYLYQLNVLSLFTIAI